MSKGSQNRLPLVSIVLLNLNGERFASLWESLFKVDYPSSRYEIVFVDNGSIDRSVEMFREIADGSPHIAVKMVMNERNLGYSTGNNLGVKQARGEYIVLVSNDILVDSDWLINMIDALERDPNIGVAQSSMFSLSDPRQVDVCAHFIDKLGYCFRAPAFVETPDIYYRDSFSSVTEVFFSEGAVMFFRREVLDKTRGLFDDDYFMFYEDIDFCWRARLVGYRVCVVPASKAYHVRGGTVDGTLIKMQPKFIFTNTRNRLETLFKNYGTLNLCRYLPLSVLFELLKSAFLLSNGKKTESREAIKGVLAFFLGLSRSTSKRVKVQRIRSADEEEIVRLMHPLGRSVRNLLISSRMISKDLK